MAGIYEGMHSTEGLSSCQTWNVKENDHALYSVCVRWRSDAWDNKTLESEVTEVFWSGRVRTKSWQKFKLWFTSHLHTAGRSQEEVSVMSSVSDVYLLV